jgi:hypothetical protein
MLVKVLGFFIENPYSEIHLRGLSKKLGISAFAAKKYLDYLVSEKVVAEERRANLRYFKANMESLFFRQLKIASSIRMLSKSGVAGHITGSVQNVSSITLFGSVAKGEDDTKSDIDLVVIGKGECGGLEKYETFLHKDINIHTFTWSDWQRQSKENRAFYFDVIRHGIVLFGELPMVV